MANPSIRKRGQSLAQGLVDALSQRIRAGTFAAGSKLPPENTIVQAYGVSRTVVREALSRLQAAGMVETRHGVGTFVLAGEPGLRLAADTAHAVGRILDVRLGLESQAAALAARHRQPTHLQGMREALDDYQANPGNDEHCAAADWQFHLLIAEATGNRYFTELMLHLGRGMIPRTQVKPLERGGDDLSALALPAAREHEAIYSAIQRQDSDGARAAMWLHLSNSRERFKAS
ncbi:MULTISPECIES: FadR/GntR family transcriptional regulator [unclassified Pseudomonas]|uniref:FadR/GntR family transcriptional regulator n=1 Tax=unclassified Pseudomonas TaxID=196821 RepID=UPI000BCBB97F|nr:MULTISPECIES: FadR/GntR family transcriptional regulator [unclassified Pseudomonas]PVZ10596.1 DNA-binding FadR family transcriptional regulator [Pseudomonas sp. URIL14HWK12:I12]PVZ22022.1 DNA-binding FadR family transcriptional regulator [Pseudomonas sp. URIL14HWK12:I10]PVZ30895.1 DNA-binding FadR family transcriptional regulator [Pseudomonas sp. URIL14HWK12:I11]SNZ17246.1 DNA-binding transcriptional regulator, FadR family [Pseudomonas sp. URIL14HWK12:I9]